MVHVFNRIGQLGLGLALTGSVVNSALYNGEYTVPKVFVIMKKKKEYTLN